MKCNYLKVVLEIYGNMERTAPRSVYSYGLNIKITAYMMVYQEK